MEKQENRALIENWIDIKTLLYVFFFLPYLGTSIPAYFFLSIYIIVFLFIKPHKIRFKAHDLIITSLLLFWALLKVFQCPINVSFVLFRYYFGFYFFYIFFRQRKVLLDFELLLCLISCCVIIEAILINTILSPTILLNYPQTLNGGDAVYQTVILGFYQRPYSIGNNASVTSTIIMVLLFYLRSLKIKYGININRGILTLSYIAVILLASGEGYILFIIYNVFILNPNKNGLRRLLSGIILIIIYLLIFIVDIGSISGLKRISKIYLYFLYDFKLGQIENVLYQLRKENAEFLGVKFNELSQLIVFSDFAWNDLLLCTGIMGFIIVIFSITVKINKNNMVPLIIFIIGALHYGAMFSLPGQLLLGYFLALSAHGDHVKKGFIK